jgi:plastocyanin
MKRTRTTPLRPILIGLGLAAALAVAAPRPARPAAGKGAVAGHVTITGADGSARNARGGVVIAIRVPGARPKAGKAEMRQKDKQFDPQVIVVTRGSTVSFPNEDKIFHNVFSISPAARFDLGLYKAGTAKSIEMKRAGEVDVYCNIHPEMAAKIKVLDTPYYAVSAPDGSFRIEGLAAGTYPVEAWHAHGDPWTGEVTVPAGGEARLDPAVVENERAVHHTRKDGTPYGRYK